jgi:hypothetical protein
MNRSSLVLCVCKCILCRCGMSCVTIVRCIPGQCWQKFRVPLWIYWRAGVGLNMQLIEALMRNCRNCDDFTPDIEYFVAEIQRMSFPYRSIAMQWLKKWSFELSTFNNRTKCIIRLHCSHVRHILWLFDQTNTSDETKCKALKIFRLPMAFSLTKLDDSNANIFYFAPNIIHMSIDLINWAAIRIM